MKEESHMVGFTGFDLINHICCCGSFMKMQSPRFKRKQVDEGGGEVAGCSGVAVWALGGQQAESAWTPVAGEVRNIFRFRVGGLHERESFLKGLFPFDSDSYFIL